MATGLVQVANYILGLLFVAVLARLISPEDFGLFAIMLSAGAILRVLVGSGLSEASVQALALSPGTASALFYINGAVGLLTGGSVFFAASPVSEIFGKPELAGLLRLLAVDLFLTALLQQHRVAMRRAMRLKPIASITFISFLAGSIVSVNLAVLGAGYWALAIGSLAGTAVNLALTIRASQWSPTAPAFDGKLIGIGKFGFHLWVSESINVVQRHADNLILGYGAHAAELGFYGRAYSLMLLPIQQVTAPASQALAPSLAKLQRDVERFRRYYQSAVLVVTSIGMPAVGLVTLNIGFFVRVFLGPDWMEVVPVFLALAPLGLLSTFNVANGWALIPIGKGRTLVQTGIIGLIINIPAYVVGAQWGAVGLGVAASIAGFVRRPIQLELAFRVAHVGWGDFWRGIRHPLICTCVAFGATVWSVGLSGFEAVTLAGFAAKTSIFCVTWGITAVMLPWRRMYFSTLVRVIESVRRRGAVDV